MAAEVFFPKDMEKIKEVRGSEEYEKLKKQLVKLDEKIDLWLLNFNDRLTNLEAKTGTGSKGRARMEKSVPRKMAAPKKA